MAGIPQVITNRSGAQVIDGSLKFDQSKSQHLIRTFTGGNRRTWTHSSWVRQGDFGRKKSFFMVGPSSGLSNSNYLSLDFDDNDKLRYAGGAENFKVTSQVFRDTGWYHVVWTCDTTEAVAVDRTKIYVNGELITAWSTSSSNPTQNFELPYNENSIVHRIGTSTPYNNDREWNDSMSQVYFIDGAALGPENFGFTDPLTNTWKPKKYDTEAPTNNPNNNTTWSSNVSASSGSFGSGEEATKGFDGNTSTKCKTDTNGASITITFSGLTVQRLLRIRTNYTNGSGSDIEVNDVSYGAAATASDGEYKTISGFTGALTKIKLEAGGSVNAAFSAIEVDGVILQDSTTTNNRTWDSSVTFGTNGFYLPMDGNSPIGQDQSGNGNDWTPVNFGGSLELDNPNVSGARPILNTLPGGTQAGVGVFGSKQNVGYAVTVYDDGGGNKYYIDGVKQDTVTGLIRGATYTFDTSDSTVSSHPFRFSATSNGSHGGGSEYTNGVAAITGAATTITVPHDAPNTLYYYCTSHSGMGSDITGITTNEKLADQYASHCTLALPLVGGDDDVCASIACTANNKTPTNSSVTAATTQSNFYGGSHYWSANSDTLQYAEQGDELVFGTGDFTIECWVYDDNGHNGGGSGRCYIFDNRIGGSVTGDPPTMVGHCDSHNEFTFYDGDSDITHSVGTTVGKWWHYAVTREGTTTRMFIDGILRGSSTSSTNFTNNGIGVGRATDGGYGWAGYIQDFRVYKGIAKYTSDFVIPATKPDILPDTPSGVSNSSKLTKITDGAVSFDGTGDFLGLANSTDTNFGSGDFTVECHAYFTSVSAETLLGQWENGSSRRSWLLQVNSGTLSSYLSADGSTSGMKRIDSASGVIVTNRWYHLAFARSGDTMRMFIDGEQVGSVDVSGFTNYANTNEGFQVGSQTAAGSNLMSGFISNARIIKGTGIYTSRFTPPSAPLTNVTNTKLLCCQSNTSAIEGAVKPGTITANGNAAATNFNPFNTDINTVRGQETGYATFNPIEDSSAGGGAALSNGNLQIDGTSSEQFRAATIPVSSGKWYFEIIQTAGTDFGPGVWAYPLTSPSSNFYQNENYRYNSNGGLYDESAKITDYSSFAVGDVIATALDMDNGKVYFAKNNTWQNSGDPAAGTGAAASDLDGTWIFGASTNGASTFLQANFGQKPFKFPPPDGFQPLNTANTRPVKVISRPDQYVGVTTYKGTTESPRKIDLPITPDMIWVKNRSTTNRGHFVLDTVRGNNNNIRPNATVTQSTANAASRGILSTIEFNSFTVKDGSTDGNNVGSTDTDDYVVWFWKAGGNKNTFNVDDVGYATAAAAGLDGGDITPTGASVGTKQGFSIIEFTGSASGTPSISHGLSEAPNFIAQKDTGATTSWRVFMYNGTTWGIMNFDDASGVTAATETAPTSSLFYANGNGNAANTQIAYLWHDVPGLQKFGTFEGNGNADGPFIELGFRPSIILMRNLDNYGTNYDWCMYDNERAKFNPDDVFQCINLAKPDNVRGDNTTDNSRDVDFLSNGFKIRNTASTLNLNAHTIFYAAWAEAPTVDLFGGGANAR